jgi:ATP-dependent exoDNAse (exonuclease V) alpha subunit
LPVELTQEQNIKLAKEYVKENFITAGMCADLCVHDNNDGNPHAHILLTMRSIEKDGRWGPKSVSVKGKKVPAVDWNERSKVEKWRKAWAGLQNTYLRKLNINVKVDHRSFERQGKDQVPTKHLGHTAFQMEKRGILTVRGDWNRYAAITNSELRQLNGRIRKVKNDLYKLPLIDAPGIRDVMNNLSAYLQHGLQRQQCQRHSLEAI